MSGYLGMSGDTPVLTFVSCNTAGTHLSNGGVILVVFLEMGQVCSQVCNICEAREQLGRRDLS